MKNDKFKELLELSEKHLDEQAQERIEQQEREIEKLDARLTETEHSLKAAELDVERYKALIDTVHGMLEEGQDVQAEYYIEEFLEG
jgi:multidrug resistance efflux pump